MLATTVAVLSEGRDTAELDALDRLLGLVEADDGEELEDDEDDPMADAEQGESEQNRAALLTAGYGRIVSG